MFLGACEIRFTLGEFKGEQHAAAYFESVLNRLEARSVRLPFVVTKIRMPRPGRDNQIVIADLGAIGQNHTAIFLVKRRRLAENDLDIFVFVQNTADRRGDLAWA